MHASHSHASKTCVSAASDCCAIEPNSSQPLLASSLTRAIVEHSQGGADGEADSEYACHGPQKYVDC